MGIEMKKDHKGDLNIQMGFRKFLIINKYVDEEMVPQFRNLLGSPE